MGTCHTGTIHRRSRIVVQTRRGHCVENAQYPEVPVRNHSAAARQLRRKYPRSVYRTNTISGMYNCHGMVFASRRTCIHDPVEVRKILNDDGYLPIRRREDVLPGDLVLYLASDGDIEHSGAMLETPSGENLYNPLVMSKWGQFSEVIHRQSECPYTKHTVAYYRIVN